MNHSFNARAGTNEDVLNLTFFIALRRDGELEAFTRELGRAESVRNVNVFFDEQEA